MASQTTPTEQADVLDLLHFHAEQWRNQGFTGHVFTLAADEIERLRAEVRRLRTKGASAAKG